MQPLLVQPSLKRWLKTSKQEDNPECSIAKKPDIILKEKNLSVDAEVAPVSLKEPSSSGSSSTKMKIPKTSPTLLDQSPSCPLSPKSIPCGKKRLSLKRRSKCATKPGSVLQEPPVKIAPRGGFQVRKRSHVNQDSSAVKRVCGVTYQALENKVLMSAADEEMMKGYATVSEAPEVSREEVEHHDVVTPRKPLFLEELCNFELPVTPAFSPRKNGSCSALFSPLYSSLASNEEKPHTPSSLNTSIPLFSTPAQSDLGTPKKIAATSTKRALFHRGGTTPSYQAMKSRHSSDVSFQDDISLSEFLNCSLPDSDGTNRINQYLVLEVGMQTCMEVGDSGR